ncbi:uncharacterized protein LOC115624142 [Scaptodrosophila lebanonensis]|uniref:Uncharacterized protein LOC115624142 n=1 Tax=Drosophila lebanonensis TaxID=7225 RepID=A0A6J2TF28_DROLE|nr:uncharacterized protein LOC115624142 [Scaptodrosophila lebanonensis]
MIESGDDVVAAATSQLDISTRLAALSRWQEEQKRLLEERQSKQREILGLEQRNMYQMLGLLQNELQTEHDMTEDSISQDQDATLCDDLEQPEMPRHHVAYQIENSLQELHPDKEASAKPKRPFLRRGEGLKQRFKIHPDQLRLDNLPRYKFSKAHPQYRAAAPAPPPQQKKASILKKRKDAEPTKSKELDPPPPLTLPEQRFQQLLLSANNACNSTPDLKSSCASTSDSISPKVRFMEIKEQMGHMPGQSADDENSTDASSMAGVCWAKVLDTQQIKPLPMLQRRTAQIRVEEEGNVSIFELLEQKAREGNIDMNSSCIRAFMARKEKRYEAPDDSDHIVVTQKMREMRLQPEVKEIIGQEEELESDEDTVGDSTLTLTPIQVGKAKVRVRFSDSNDTHEYTDGATLSANSTVNGNVELFEQFKTALFQALEQKKAQCPSTEEPLAQELHAKANLVRERLQELETEIATFKEQNSQLLHLKQQHELEKARCAQEHLEAMERVHDEKIQAEIYLHDERMKIEEERRKFEQQMRLHKSNVNSKEKKELAALKQEVDALQLQLKQKEQAHVSAQARLRAQMRALEKEQRSYRDEIELLGKENKRLEQELIRLGRENNNKMLQEINRNIARLAPKVTPNSSGQILDENGRRTRSLDVVEMEKPAKERESTRRRGSNAPNANTRSRSRSLGRTKKPPEALEESYASSSSSADSEALEVTPTTRKVHSKAENNVDSTATELKREITNADGSKDIWYPNGNLKKISADGMSVRMLYFNKDIKETDIRAGTVKYYYAETNTWHTSYLDGLEILEFPNGQTEHRHKNGVIEIHFPNNTIKIVDPSDTEKLEEWRYADGTHLVQLRNGDKILNLPNGQKEIHTKLNKRREYPDGTVKMVYPDGSQETRYSNGRVRLKDKDGKLIMDTDYAKY